MSSQDSPAIFTLSLDYELFFGKSGSFEDCLFRPCEIIERFCKKQSIQVTYFVDAGMLVKLRELASGDSAMRRAYDDVRRHVEHLALQGHEIGLHVHPHWKETRWYRDEWDFMGTRYRLDQFDRIEADEIVVSYAAELQKLTPRSLVSYRAGGFCIEPFEFVRSALQKSGITIDSSVVPGASLVDEEKGFDFRRAPDRPGWTFSESPTSEDPDGEFVEVPITPLRLPFFHYWGRVLGRLLPQDRNPNSPAGRSKRIGHREIMRRLSGRSNISELSIDSAKAPHIPAPLDALKSRSMWHVMGHPKLVTHRSLEALNKFLDRLGERETMTVGDFGQTQRRNLT